MRGRGAAGGGALRDGSMPCRVGAPVGGTLLGDPALRAALAAGLFEQRSGSTKARVDGDVPRGPRRRVLEGWLGMPAEQRAPTLGPMLLGQRVGDLLARLRDAFPVLREGLDVFPKLDAVGLGEGAGYKVASA